MSETTLTPAGDVAGRPGPPPSAITFPDARARRRYRIVVGVLLAVALGSAFTLLAWDNPMPIGSDGFWRIAELRATGVTAMLIAAFCQAMATVAFQTVTNNRILTPSILGFESLYAAVQTGAIYLLGVAGLVALTGVPQFILQLVIMVGLAVTLYGWLLSGRFANLHLMLLIGIIVGGGLRAVSTFMQRLLTPSEFDLLTARLFGSVNNADASYFPVAIPLVIVAGAALWWRSRRLDVLGLGREASINLGLDHRREVMVTLTLIAVLMAVSTALIGPMTFFGFLVATLAYQFCPSFSHRRIFPVAFLLGFVVLAGAYVIMRHVFYAQGVVSIIIELVGGAVFLVVILRKGRL